jgi:AmmeMemoRadiSam system protein A
MLRSKAKGSRAGAAGAIPLRPDEQAFPTALARRAVETYICGGKLLKSAAIQAPPPFRVAGACFVCLKTDAGRLRGCVGTVTPARETLAEEILWNAVGAATRDSRFRPVAADELPLLRYTVDVLESPEPAAPDELDPAEFGVIVEDTTGRRRGLLLPAIEGIEEVSRQVEIARRKAGIAAGEPLKLYRFRVRRFREAM